MKYQINQKYRNKKTGVVGVITEVNEKFKTVILEFEDGTGQNVATATMNRYWTLDEEAVEVKEEATVEEVMPEPEAAVPEEPKKPAVKKPAKEKKVREKAVAAPEVGELLDFINKAIVKVGGATRTQNVKNKLILHLDGRGVAIVTSSNKNVRIKCRQQVADKVGQEPNVVIKERFSCVYEFAALKGNEKLIEKLIAVSYDVQKTMKTTKKEEK